MTGDRARPVSSRLSHACTAAIATADAAADASRETSVRRANVTIGLKAVARIATLPFPASVNKAAGAQQLTRSIKAAMMEILIRSNDRGTAGLKSPSWVLGSDLPLLTACMRAITPEKTSLADMTTMIDAFCSAGIEERRGGSLWFGGLYSPAVSLDDALRLRRHGGGLHKAANFWRVHEDASLRF